MQEAITLEGEDFEFFVAQAVRICESTPVFGFTLPGDGPGAHTRLRVCYPADGLRIALIKQGWNVENPTDHAEPVSLCPAAEEEIERRLCRRNHPRFFARREELVQRLIQAREQHIPMTFA